MTEWRWRVVVAGAGRSISVRAVPLLVGAGGGFAGLTWALPSVRLRVGTVPLYSWAA